jgi:hypothetical protein
MRKGNPHSRVPGSPLRWLPLSQRTGSRPIFVPRSPTTRKIPPRGQEIYVVRRAEICAPDGRSDIGWEFTADRRFDRDGVKAVLMASPTMAHLSQSAHRFTFSEVCERIPGFEEP